MFFQASLLLNLIRFLTKMRENALSAENVENSPHFGARAQQRSLPLLPPFRKKLVALSSVALRVHSRDATSNMNEGQTDPAQTNAIQNILIPILKE